MAAIDLTRSRSSVPPPPRRESATLPAVRIAPDGFVPDAIVDGWTRSGAATRAGALLTLSDGRRYVLRDAVRVIGRRNGDTDPYGFTGRVEALRELLRRGVTLAADAIRLGPAAYDVEYGVIAAPCER